MTSTVLIIILSLAFASAMFVLWVVFRQDGFLERLLQVRDESFESLLAAVEAHGVKLAALEAENARLEQVCADTKDSVNRRMASIESRNGKLSKKQQEEALAQQFFQSQR